MEGGNGVFLFCSLFLIEMVTDSWNFYCRGRHGRLESGSLKEVTSGPLDWEVERMENRDEGTLDATFRVVNFQVEQDI